MDPTAVAGMIFTLILTVIIGGLILLFPLSRRLGLLIESKIREKDAVREGLVDDTQLKEMIRSLEAQVRLLAERQEFTEKLLATREQQALPGKQDTNR